MVVLAFLRRSDYSPVVPEKKGNGRGNLNITKAHKPRKAVFLRAYVIASFLWVAVAGGLCLLGSFVSSFQPVTCHSPHLEMGGGLTTTQRIEIMTRAQLYREVKTAQAFSKAQKVREEAERNRLILNARILAFNLDPETKRPRLRLVKSNRNAGGNHA